MLLLLPRVLRTMVVKQYLVRLAVYVPTGRIGIVFLSIGSALSISARTMIQVIIVGRVWGEDV